MCLNRKISLQKFISARAFECGCVSIFAYKNMCIINICIYVCVYMCLYMFIVVVIFLLKFYVNAHPEEMTERKVKHASTTMATNVRLAGWWVS